MNNNENKYFLIHFGEIILKWKNRKFFENKLIENLKTKLWSHLLDYKKEFWKLILFWEEKSIEKALNTTFWIKNRSKCFILDFKHPQLDEILLKQIIEIIKNNLNLKQTNTIKIETKRSNKNFQPNSVEINKIIASTLLKEFPHLKIDLKNAEKTIYIEIWQRQIYIYFEKHLWLWWLPVWTSGKWIVLLSWWIDSPVASYLMNKRWMKLIFFHAYNQRGDKNGKIKEKIIKLVKKLSEYNLESTLYLIPMCPIIDQIIEKTPPKWRILVFKRSIVRIANQIADKEKALAIISGDNLAQVASQTLENINTIYKVSKYPILPPLIWFDKDEIINLSKKIGTYDISIIPAEDLCSRIAHKHPITKASEEKIKKIDTIKIPDIENINYEKLIIAPNSK